MKKVLAIMLVFASLFAFAACAGKENEKTTENTIPETQATTADVSGTTKNSAIAGKKIMLISKTSRDFVEISTNSDGVATVMMVHKVYDTEKAFQDAVAKGDYGTYKFQTTNSNPEIGYYEIIFSDSETVKGMTYDEIMAEAEKLGDRYEIVTEDKTFS